MKAVVMAGGEGSRLRPLTLGRPKPMVPIATKPVMQHNLDLLKRHGITEVVVTVQYLASMIQDYFGDGSQLGMKIIYSVEESPLGTAGSVKLAQKHLTDTFLVISADALTDFDLTQIVEFHKEKKALATLTLYRVPNPLEYGVIITREDGTIVQFLEKPSWGEVFSDTVNTGIYVLEPEVLDYFEPNKVFDFSQELFPMMLKKGDPLYGFIAPGYWCDVGNLQEYIRANADLLSGKVAIPLPGKHMGGGVWVDEGADIAPDAQLYGPVCVGREAKVKSGAVVHGPSVIGEYSVVDTRCHVVRSVIWNNSYLGERVEVHGAIVGKQCHIESKAVLFEGAVIGDGTVVRDGAIIQPNVKIWPNKEIETGATVGTSIIWGAQGRRVLFGRYGVTGLVNIDLTPEFAAKLGAAFGATLPKGAVVAVNRDPNRTPRMIKRAIISGLPSAGVNVADLASVPIPVARYITRVSEAQAGIDVRLSPFDNRVVDIKFFDQNGMDISKPTERKIENTFFREDFRRVYLDEVGLIYYQPRVIEAYSESFLQAMARSTLPAPPEGFTLVVDYSNSLSSTILSPILRQGGTRVVALNAAVEDARPMASPEEHEVALTQCASISAALRASMGARIDPGGERVFLVTGTGQILPGMTALAAMADLVFRAKPGAVVAVPVSASRTIDELAARHGGKVIRTRVNPHSMMEAAARERVAMLGDGNGGFIFPAFHPSFDGMFAIAQMMGLLAAAGASLADVVGSLPPYFMSSTKVSCPWERKGRIMRILHEQYRDGQTKQIDGVRIDLGNEWVLILPDPDRPIFHVIAESTSSDQARVLQDKYAALISGLQD
ncbi:MAG: sugar phosphate nucleotidyltransferase [Sphingomonadaceae bacterium]